jgi:hypothetical protein
MRPHESRTAGSLVLKQARARSYNRTGNAIADTGCCDECRRRHHTQLSSKRVSGEAARRLYDTGRISSCTLKRLLAQADFFQHVSTLEQEAPGFRCGLARAWGSVAAVESQEESKAAIAIDLPKYELVVEERPEHADEQSGGNADEHSGEQLRLAMRYRSAGARLSKVASAAASPASATRAQATACRAQSTKLDRFEKDRIVRQVLTRSRPSSPVGLHAGTYRTDQRRASLSPPVPLGQWG